MALELINISKYYQARNSQASIHVLDHLQCKIEQGKFISIVGPSGCGKTTLLRIIAGLEKASYGSVLFNGRELLQGTDEVGFVFQEYALFPWRTTLQNIEFGLEIKNIRKSIRKSMAIEYVELFKLSGFENRYPYELSGGMKQRAAIARTLVLKPRVILMDEPFGSLDSQTRNDMQTFLLDIWKRRGETILFVTHNVDEAVYMSDQIFILSKRPARIIDVFDIDISRPRDRTSKECNLIRKAILGRLVTDKG